MANIKFNISGWWFGVACLCVGLAWGLAYIWGHREGEVLGRIFGRTETLEDLEDRVIKLKNSGIAAENPIPIQPKVSWFTANKPGNVPQSECWVVHNNATNANHITSGYKHRKVGYTLCGVQFDLAAVRTNLAIGLQSNSHWVISSNPAPTCDKCSYLYLGGTTRSPEWKPPIKPPKKIRPKKPPINDVLDAKGFYWFKTASSVNTKVHATTMLYSYGNRIRSLCGLVTTSYYSAYPVTNPYFGEACLKCIRDLDLVEP